MNRTGGAEAILEKVSTELIRHVAASYHYRWAPMSLMKLIVISVLVITCSAVFLIGTMPIWGGWLMQHSMKETYDAISNISLPCGPGTSQVIKPWSKGGYSVSCRNNQIKDGPWQAWENGHISISGAYAKDKEHGVWLFYTDKGTQIYRTITYENGTELSNVVH